MFRELTPPETYAELASHDDAILVDCRSPAEWHLPAAAIWLTWNFSKTPHMKHMKRTWQTGRNSGDTNPERAFIGWQVPWAPADAGVDPYGPGPWLQMFQNAQKWAAENGK